MLVKGIATVSWTVELPDGEESEDVAIDAVMDYLPGQDTVQPQGAGGVSAKVVVDLHRDDVDVEDPNLDGLGDISDDIDEDPEDDDGFAWFGDEEDDEKAGNRN